MKLVKKTIYYVIKMLKYDFQLKMTFLVEKCLSEFKIRIGRKHIVVLIISNIIPRSIACQSIKLQIFAHNHEVSMNRPKHDCLIKTSSQTW